MSDSFHIHHLVYNHGSYINTSGYVQGESCQYEKVCQYEKTPHCDVSEIFVKEENFSTHSSNLAQVDSGSSQKGH